MASSRILATTSAARTAPTGWGEYIWANPALGDSLQGLFSDGFIRSFITRDLAYNTANWDVNQWLPEMSLVGSMYHAFNPDLSGLQARGAKMIVMNGATDTSVTPKDASRYYDMVVQTMGQANADKVLETFIEPGVGHCVGGVGPDTVDLMKALTTWVEAGTPPSAQNLTLSRLDATTGAVTMTRPLCKYPSYPRYSGSGDATPPAASPARRSRPSAALWGRSRPGAPVALRAESGRSGSRRAERLS
jgi:feruloyl esterase